MPLRILSRIPCNKRLLNSPPGTHRSVDNPLPAKKIFPSLPYFHRRNLLKAWLFLLLAAAITGCSNKEEDADKNIYDNLELNGKINTFPLCIVLSDKLSGPEFPADLKELCSFSKATCKTLPIAGILRSGADIYYTYNCFADLKIPASTSKDEADITQAVEKQVSTYYSNTRLNEYDSLLTPNLPEWSIKTLPAMYINNTSDSVFFYSNQPGAPSTIEVGSRSYPVYTSVAQLRQEIDKMICKRYEKVAVFYNPVFSDSAKGPVKPLFAARGKRAGDTCIQTGKWEKLHNGAGGFILGKLLEKDSKGCGFTPPPPPQAAVAIDKPVPAAQGAQIQSNPVRRKPEPTAVPTEPPVAANASRTDNPRSGEKLRSDNQCVRRSEPVCEQDENKNFTGRRVQYCYNQDGKVIRTIVISKCESDCRCF